MGAMFRLESFNESFQNGPHSVTNNLNKYSSLNKESKGHSESKLRRQPCRQDTTSELHQQFNAHIGFFSQLQSGPKSPSRVPASHHLSLSQTRPEVASGKPDHTRNFTSSLVQTAVAIQH